MLAAGALHHPHDGRRFLLFFGTSAVIALLHNKWFIFPVVAFYGWEWLCRAGPVYESRIRLVNLGNSILKSRPVAFMADCSYGVYLWHIPVQLVMMRLLLDSGLLANKQPIERMVLLTASALPLVYGVSWITFRLVEKPGIEVGKRLLRKPIRPALAVNSEAAS
jgi:peptidoglycan/LPS O-acetylase OafA/YrhL